MTSRSKTRRGPASPKGRSKGRAAGDGHADRDDLLMSCVASASPRVASLEVSRLYTPTGHRNRTKRTNPYCAVVPSSEQCSRMEMNIPNSAKDSSRDCMRRTFLKSSSVRSGGFMSGRLHVLRHLPGNAVFRLGGGVSGVNRSLASVLDLERDRVGNLVRWLGRDLHFRNVTANLFERQLRLLFLG